MANTPYKNRNVKDRKILVGLAGLSLPERFKRLQNLKLEIQKMEELLANKRSGSQNRKTKASNFGGRRRADRV